MNADLSPDSEPFEAASHEVDLEAAPADSSHVDTLAAEVGRRLRDRRAAREETLQTVASGADISLSHLAEIETGKTSCSLPVLLRLSRALDYPLAQILPTLGESRTRVDTVHSTEVQRSVSHEGLDLIVRSVNLKAGEATDVGLDLCEAIIYVVSGSSEVSIAPTRTTLQRGDSAEIRRSPYVSISAIEDLVAVVIIGSG